MRLFSRLNHPEAKWLARHSLLDSVSALLIQKGRCLSSSSSNQYISCFGSHPDADVESVEDYLEKHPMLREVKSDRLITMDPMVPYFTAERGRRFMWSTTNIPLRFHGRNQSTLGMFRSGTFGVVKPLGVLAIKDFNFESDGEPLNDDVKRSDYDEACEYILSLLCQRYGEDIHKHLTKDVKNWFLKMKQKDNLKEDFDEDDIAFDPCLLPRESRGPLGLELFMQLRRAMPLRGEDTKHILADIASSSLKKGWPDNVNRHKLLNSWTPYDHKWRSPQDGIYEAIMEADGSTNQPDGVQQQGTLSLLSQLFTPKTDQIALDVAFAGAIVDLHRHAYVHTFEKDVIELIEVYMDDKFPGLSRNYTIWDVIDLLHYVFPEYFPQALKSIKKHRLSIWKKINIKSRFPVWPYFAEDFSDGVVKVTPETSPLGGGAPQVIH